jgi:uncharacterized protein (DUF2126 family)
MMEPLSVSFIVGLLAAHAERLVGRGLGVAAQQVEDALTERLSALAAAVRRYFADDHGATDALDRLDQAPDDHRRRAAVEDRLDEAMQRDPALAGLVSELAEAVRRTPGGSMAVEVRDAGAVALQGDVSIHAGQHAAGRDLIVGRPAEADRP